MLTIDDLKKQRDRFLAFSFAGADVLIEIDNSGAIQFASGSVKHLTGIDEGELVGKSFRDIFDNDSQVLVDLLLSNTRYATKTGPYLVTIQNAQATEKNKLVYLSSLRMSENSPISCSVSYGEGLNQAIVDNALRRPQIQTPKEFEVSLRKKLPEMISKNNLSSVRLVELDNVRTCQDNVDEDQWGSLMDSVSETIMSLSVDGDSAVKIVDGKYLLLNNDNSPPQELENRLATITKDFKVDNLLTVATKNIPVGVRPLNQKELTRAILYTVEKMEKHGLENTSDDLKTSFDSFMQENIAKISRFKRIISHQEFNLNFQPIVDINTEEISHHEVLVRFNGDASPYELLTMGEDIGLAPDIDLSICRQAIKYIDFNMSRNFGKFAVNISGSSIQQDSFMDRLLEILRDYSKASKSLLFEITESSEIKEFEKVNNFIQVLRKSGYAVCLDDFGAGAASFQYLHQFHIDGIKIDGSYIKTVLSSPRDATMVKNITKMCHELGVYVVAEMIETREQARFLRDIGIDKGQGWLYGKAQIQPLVSSSK